MNNNYKKNNKVSEGDVIKHHLLKYSIRSNKEKECGCIRIRSHKSSLCEELSEYYSAIHLIVNLLWKGDSNAIEWVFGDGRNKIKEEKEVLIKHWKFI